MDKTRILLLGTNTTVINDYFTNMDEYFEMQSSSLRFDDIMSHLKYFEPEGIVMCLSTESYDDISRMVSVKNRIDNDHIPFIIVGDEDLCNEFSKSAVNVADFIIPKPFTTSSLQNRTDSFLKNWQERYPRKKRTEAGSPDSSSVDRPEVASIMQSLRMDSAAVNKSFKDQNTTPHILIVDDDPLMQRSIKAHLKDKYTVGAAISGEVALKFLEKKSTDLILLDYEMPGEKGPEVLAKLRANPKTADIPVIFLTGTSDQRKVASALALKPQGYMLKPINREDLLARVKELVGQ